jgi:elongation factor G
MSQPNNFSKPVITATIEPKTKDARDELGQALARIAQDDPTLRVHIDSETGQTTISGMSEQHLELIADILMSKYDVAVNLSNPTVIYLETIRSMAIGEGKYIRQIGGQGNYGHVKIRIAPSKYGKGYEFSNDTREDSIPAEYIRAIDQGVQEGMRHGVLTGSEMVDIEVSLYDGSYHDDDSNEMAFTIAASMAFKETARKARPVLLEPVMQVEVTVHEEYMGAVINDLNSRRGLIEDMQMLDGSQIIRAVAPLSTMLGYPAQLRSLSYGRANCSIKFEKYEVAPYPPEDDWQAPVRMK